MTSTSTTNASQNNNDSSNENVGQKDIVISIIYSESTASFLEIRAPHLEDIIQGDSDTDTSMFSMKSLNIFRRYIPTKRTSGHSLIDFYSRSNINNVNTNVIYLSKNFGASNSVANFDDLLCVSHNSEEIVPESPLLMEKYKIYTRPELAAKTTAHQNKMKCEFNRLYVSVLESELTITGSGWINFCRICHGGESTAELLTPCRCKGSIALAHLECLEEWLRQSSSSRCELCQHHYDVIREPKYSIPWSILVFLTHPGDRLKEFLLDIFGFLVYTPTAIASTYLLMVLCDNISIKHNLQYNRNFTSHFLAFTAVFGMAIIDFTYSSWLVVTFKRHIDAWKEWYRNNCTIRVNLPPRKLRRSRKRNKQITAQLD